MCDGILGKMRPHLGKTRPIWAICMKGGQKCSRIGIKNLIMKDVLFKVAVTNTLALLPWVKGRFSASGIG